MKKLIKTDVLLTPLHINTLLYNLLVGLSLKATFSISFFLLLVIVGPLASVQNTCIKG